MRDDENYYELLQNEEYKTLLDREIQMNNARERALKQTNASLGALGLTSSGYAQTAQSGIESQYLTAMEGANQTYQQNMQNLNLQKMQGDESKQNDEYSLFTTLLTETSDAKNLNYLMKEYDLLDDEGNFDVAKATNLYGASNAKQLQYLYKLQYEGIESNIYQGVGVEANDTNMALQTFTDQNGKTGTLNDEIKSFFKPNGVLWVQSGYRPKNGDVVKVSSNLDANANYCFLIYRDGKWYQTTAQQYSIAETKHNFSVDINQVVFWDNKNLGYQKYL